MKSVVFREQTRHTLSLSLHSWMIVVMIVSRLTFFLRVSVLPRVEVQQLLAHVLLLLLLKRSLIGRLAVWADLHAAAALRHLYPALFILLLLLRLLLLTLRLLPGKILKIHELHSVRV